MTTPRTPSPADEARERAARAEAEAGLALARFEAMSRGRDLHRRGTTLVPLGEDPAAAAPTGWAEHHVAELVGAASAAQPLSPAEAQSERSRLLWIALAKLVGAVLAGALGVGTAVAMGAGMAG
ncbi:hypothetical protein [Dietzia sp. 179-F 9C3 NHS]|uniref:hypothetical protein n=1 Tax=Dietzia sp. 179-F 9C3 NHS TaxID=3374295 RepID=UPI00387A40F5